MSFLTSNPELSSTIYSGVNLNEPRQYLLDVINIVDSTWLDEPQGPLGEYWNRNDAYATCYLIWIARMLVTVGGYISPESMPRLATKFGELLHAKSEEQFLRTRAELEVAWAFVDRVSPIILEPLASVEESRIQSSLLQPSLKSPDFAFDLTDERVYSEVTFFSVRKLEKWQKAVDFITATIQKRLLDKGRSLKLRVQLPLQEFDAGRIIRRVWSEICTSGDTGKLTVIANGTISWEPYRITPLQEDFSSTTEGTSTPKIQITPDGGWEILFRFKALKQNPTGFIEFSSSGLTYTPDYFVDKASFVREPDIVVLSEKDVHLANSLVLKAFQNKLNDKREQYTRRHKNPYILVMKLGHYRLQGQGLVQMIERDIWTKQDYKWVTGIILYTSRRGFLPTDAGPQLDYNFNPNADCPASDALKSLFEGTTKFHPNF